MGPMAFCSWQISYVLSVSPVDSSVYVSLRDLSSFFHEAFSLLRRSGIAAPVFDYILLCVREATLIVLVSHRT